MGDIAVGHASHRWKRRLDAAPGFACYRVAFDPRPRSRRPGCWTPVGTGTSPTSSPSRKQPRCSPRSAAPLAPACCYLFRAFGLTASARMRPRAFFGGTAASCRRSWSTGLVNCCASIRADGATDRLHRRLADCQGPRHRPRKTGGYRGKKITGRGRHVAVDSEGRLLARGGHCGVRQRQGRGEDPAPGCSTSSPC
jgi:hypothetical protein